MEKTKRLVTSIVGYIYELGKYQVTRLYNRGYGTIISLITFSFYFTYYPDIIAYFWPTLLSKMDEIPLFLLVVFSLNFILSVSYSLVMYVIYTQKFPFLEQYRISQQPWPWESNYEQWMKLFYRSLSAIFKNALICGPILIIIDCNISFQVKMKMEDIPQSKWTYLWQFAFFVIVEQIWNYLMHALLHQPQFYWIHKPHHQFSIPVSIAGQYTTPIQYLISNAVSTSLGYKILCVFYPVHMFSLIIWLTFRVIETSDSHAGYNWPWIQSALIPGNSGDNYHYHHHRVNIGNYAGIMYFMDSLFGTNKTFWEYNQKLKAQQQKYIHSDVKLQ